MHSIAKLVVAAALASQASAKTITVAVGKSGLTFSPDTITAAVGDTLQFHFYPADHSVAMGDFTAGCTPATSGGFYSDFVPVSSGVSTKVFSVEVNSTDPMAFYCSQGSHCQSGMYGVVNPAGAKSLSAYGTLAKAASSNTSPSQGVFGGSFGTGSSSPSSTGSSGGSSSTSAASGGYGGSETSSSSSGGASPTNSAKPGAAGTVKAGFGGLLGAVAAAMFMI